jgi:hypothetical protein
MPAFNEALAWEDRAEQARDVAGRFIDPGAKQGDASSYGVAHAPIAFSPIREDAGR